MLAPLILDIKNSSLRYHQRRSLRGPLVVIAEFTNIAWERFESLFTRTAENQSRWMVTKCFVKNKVDFLLCNSFYSITFTVGGPLEYIMIYTIHLRIPALWKTIFIYVAHTTVTPLLIGTPCIKFPTNRSIYYSSVILIWCNTLNISNWLHNIQVGFTVFSLLQCHLLIYTSVILRVRKRSFGSTLYQSKARFT